VTPRYPSERNMTGREKEGKTSCEKTMRSVGIAENPGTQGGRVIRSGERGVGSYRRGTHERQRKSREYLINSNSEWVVQAAGERRKLEPKRRWKAAEVGMGGKNAMQKCVKCRREIRHELRTFKLRGGRRGLGKLVS